MRETLARARAWSLALATLVVFLVPTIRASELNEAGSPKERIEDVSIPMRTTGLLRSALHGRREAVVFASSTQSRLGCEQRRPEPLASDGHRLPNGLLAPMTC